MAFISFQIQRKLKQMLPLMIECMQESEIDRKGERNRMSLDPKPSLKPVSRGRRGKERKRDKYGAFCERSLTVTARGERKIDHLEQLVLLTLAMRDTNHWSNLWWDNNSIINTNNVWSKGCRRTRSSVLSWPLSSPPSAPRIFNNNSQASLPDLIWVSEIWSLHYIISLIWTHLLFPFLAQWKM